MNVFQNPDAIATSLLLEFATKYGLSPLIDNDQDERWDPTTIQLNIVEDYGGLAPWNLAKLMTAVELILTDNFESSLPDFIRIVSILSDEASDEFDLIDPYEIAWANIEAQLIRGASKASDFSAEIRAFVVERLKQTGTQFSPVFSGLVELDEVPMIQTSGQMDQDSGITLEGLIGGRNLDIDDFVRQQFKNLITQLAGNKQALESLESAAKEIKSIELNG